MISSHLSSDGSKQANKRYQEMPFKSNHGNVFYHTHAAASPSVKAKTMRPTLKLQVLENLEKNGRYRKMVGKNKTNSQDKQAAYQQMIQRTDQQEEKKPIEIPQATDEQQLEGGLGINLNSKTDI